MSRRCTVRFEGIPHAPLQLAAGADLSEHLTVLNSPVLFGCRTGICGTCMVELSGDVPPPGESEAETLEILADGRSGVRLACQVHLQGDIVITARPPGAAVP